MSHTMFSKSAVCLLICVVSGLSLNSTRTAKAQYGCSTCIDQQVIVPEYLKFGVDPYNPRQIYPAPFTPLQLNWYHSVPTNSCPTCERLSHGNLVPNNQTPTITGPLEAPGEIAPAAPDVAPPAVETDDENTTSSPSDILVSPAKPTEPTLADDASSETIAQLDEARKQIARLKGEMASTKEQSRAAMDRLYAAEKATNAAKSKAEESLEKMTKMRQQQAKKAELAAARQREQQKKLDAVLLQLKDLEKLAAKAQMNRKPKANDAPSDAEKRLAKLKADAEKAVPEKMKKPRKPNQKKNEGSKKKKPAELSTDQQVKMLQESLKRQVKNSSAKIRKRNQLAIEKLIDKGSKESDPEVQEIKDKMNSELKKNESKIRQRIEQRIQQLRKEAAARAIS